MNGPQTDQELPVPIAAGHDTGGHTPPAVPAPTGTVHLDNVPNPTAPPATCAPPAPTCSSSPAPGPLPGPGRQRPRQAVVRRRPGLLGFAAVVGVTVLALGHVIGQVPAMQARVAEARSAWTLARDIATVAVTGAWRRYSTLCHHDSAVLRSGEHRITGCTALTAQAAGLPLGGAPANETGPGGRARAVSRQRSAVPTTAAGPAMPGQEVLEIASGPRGGSEHIAVDVDIDLDGAGQ